MYASYKTNVGLRCNFSIASKSNLQVLLWHLHCFRKSVLALQLNNKRTFVRRRVRNLCRRNLLRGTGDPPAWSTCWTACSTTGLRVAGDIKVSLAEVELLTMRIRLLICSIDKAEQIGLDWWKFDHHLSPGKQKASAENDELRTCVPSSGSMCR